ncbi:hypothetical protein [Brevibacillus laterosporus]|uniref:hypothetical protein n=1 Tax=Brevibacillus laterosporus TaxID=1465 RepID=UPI0013C3FAA2|nr:hypothetical protein [Brevibacillus laterosporus]
MKFIFSVLVKVPEENSPYININLMAEESIDGKLILRKAKDFEIEAPLRGELTENLITRFPSRGDSRDDSSRIIKL